MSDDLGPFAGLPGIFVGSFGEPATWSVDGGLPVAISGIFIEPFTLVDLEGIGVDGSSPTLHVRADDVPSIAHGHAISVRSRQFTVTDVQPDSKGMVKLALQEA